MQNDGGQAFPHVHEGLLADHPRKGMTLCDFFAAAALTGLSETAWTRFQHNVSTDPIAVLAYELAGAMLREREKQCK